jgi:hypothetical protein
MFRVFNTLAASAVLVGGLCSMAAAAVYDDVADGNWNVAATWGAASYPSMYAPADTVTIDSNTVTNSGGQWGEEVWLNTGGTLVHTGTNIANALGVHLNGGLWEWSLSATYYFYGTGANTNPIDVAADTEIRVDSSPFGLAGTAGADTYFTGGNTKITKTGAGKLIVRVNQAVAPTWSGYLDLTEGAMEIPSTANLNYSINIGAGLNLVQANSGGHVEQRAGLTGTGTYGPATGGLSYYTVFRGAAAFLDPGQYGDHANAGTLTVRQYDAGSNRRIEVTENAEVRIDVTSDTTADLLTLNQMLALDSTAGTGSALRVRLFKPTSTGSFDLVVVSAGEIRELGGGAGDGAFSNVIFEDYLGNEIVGGNGAGFSNLAVAYDYASATETVSVSGDFEPVPEPATLGLMGLGLAGLAAQRRRR